MVTGWDKKDWSFNAGFERKHKKCVCSSNVRFIKSIAQFLASFRNLSHMWLKKKEQLRVRERERERERERDVGI